MKFTFNILLVTLFLSLVGCVEDFPAFVDRCKFEDNECLIRQWNKYVKLSGEMAIPELSLDNLHEYNAGQFALSSGSDAISFKITFSNATVIGLDTTTMTKIIGFPKDPKMMTKFELIGHMPHFIAKGNYKATGKFLLIPLTGEGFGEIKFLTIKYKFTCYTKTEVRDGEEYLIITKVLLSYQNEKLDNLFNNKKLSDTLNVMFNENEKLISKEIMEPVGAVVASYMKKILVPVFKRFPYRSFFLEN